MLLIDFQWTEGQAFARGFMKGLAAPVILFGHFEMYPIQIPYVSIQGSGVHQPIVNDMTRVIGDLTKTIVSNEAAA